MITTKAVPASPYLLVTDAVAACLATIMNDFADPLPYKPSAAHAATPCE